MTQHDSSGAIMRSARSHAIGVAVMGCLSMAAYLGVIGPRLAAGEVLDASRARYRAAVTDVAQAEQEVTKAKAASERFASELAKGGVVLKASSMLNATIAEVSAVAEAGGLKLTEISPGAETITPTHSRFAIRIRCSGSYPDVTRVIAALHTKFPDLALVAFSLHGNANDPKAAAAVQLDFEWYAMRSDKSAAVQR